MQAHSIDGRQAAGMETHDAFLCEARNP